MSKHYNLPPIQDRDERSRKGMMVGIGIAAIFALAIVAAAMTGSTHTTSPYGKNGGTAQPAPAIPSG